MKASWTYFLLQNYMDEGVSGLVGKFCLSEQNKKKAGKMPAL